MIDLLLTSCDLSEEMFFAVKTVALLLTMRGIPCQAHNICEVSEYEFDENTTYFLIMELERWRNDDWPLATYATFGGIQTHDGGMADIGIIWIWMEAAKNSKYIDKVCMLLHEISHRWFNPHTCYNCSPWKQILYNLKNLRNIISTDIIGDGKIPSHLTLSKNNATVSLEIRELD